MTIYYIAIAIVAFVIGRISLPDKPLAKPRTSSEAVYFYERSNGKVFNEVVTTQLDNLLGVDLSDKDAVLTDLRELFSAEDWAKIEDMVAQLNQSKSPAPIVVYVAKQAKYYECVGLCKDHPGNRQWIEIWFRDVTHLQSYFAKLSKS